MVELQGAIDSANGPRTIRLPAGTHILSSSVNLKSNITIEGQGTRLVFAAAPAPIGFYAKGQSFDRGRISRIDPSRRRITIEKGTGWAPGDMLHLVHSGIDGHTAEVSSIEQGSGSTVLILNHALPRWAAPGQLLLEIEPVSNVTLRQFEIVGTQNPVWFDGTSDALVSNLTISGSALNTLFLRSLRPTAVRNVLDGVGGGFSFLSCHNIVANNNTVVKHQRAGIFFRYSTDSEASENRMSGIPGAVAIGGNGDGMTFAHCERVLVARNDIRHTSCYGMWVLDCAQTTVTHNQTLNCYTTSYYMTDGSDNVISNNIASTNAVGFGFTVERAARTRIVDNLAYLVPRGFHITDTIATTFERNRAVSCREPDFFAGNRP